MLKKKNGEQARRDVQSTTVRTWRASLRYYYTAERVENKPVMIPALFQPREQANSSQEPEDDDTTDDCVSVGSTTTNTTGRAHGPANK